MTLTLSFRLKLDSDYHVGSGHGAGTAVDSALLRDHDRAPLLRGTMLAGLLRDGLCDLRELAPMQQAEASAIDDAAVRLFGSPARRKNWAYASARIEERGESKLAGRWGSQDVSRIRVSPRTRRSAPQQLFKEEEGDSRAAFGFTATCEHPTVQDESDAALLVAASRMVRHLGAARRRGRGECEIILEKAAGLPSGGQWTQDEALETFKERWLANSSLGASSSITPRAAPGLEGLRLRFRIIARMEEPVIVARRSESGNVYESIAGIPGSSLLGALANRAAKMLGLSPEQKAPEEFVALFIRGGVSVTGLLPAEQDRHGNRLYPTIAVPSDLFGCENYPDRHRLKSFALTTDVPSTCDECGADLTPLSKLSPLLTLRNRPLPHRLLQREEAHIQMNRKTGRVLTGALYEYVALEAGQWLTGELACANEDCWGRLQELTGIVAEGATQLRLGKASQRGYGLVTLAFQNALADSSPWVLRPLEHRVLSLNTFSMTLLSDAIIVDDWGRYELGFDNSWVARLMSLDPDHINLVGQYASTKVIDSFNASRRAPRWRDEAIIAGSAAGIEVLPDGLRVLKESWSSFHPDLAPPDELTALRWRLQQIETQGIGLRTVEGFGRVAFNHSVYSPTADNSIGSGMVIPDLNEFRPSPVAGRLVGEARFRLEYEDHLLEREARGRSDNDELFAWDALSESQGFDAVARLLFLSRARNAETIQSELKRLIEPEQVAWMPAYLWGKSLPERGKESKLDNVGVQLISRLIDELWRKVGGRTDQRWAAGLEMLARRVSELARKGATK